MAGELTFGLANQIPELKTQSKASGVYGIDVMVTESGQVKLLEVTVSPDCERAQRDHGDFWNEILDVVMRGRISKNFETVF